MATAYELPPILQRIEIDGSGYKTAMDQLRTDSQNAQKNIESGWKKLETTGNTLGKIGKKMTLGVTAPLTIMGKQAYDTYSSVDTAFRGVQKTTDLTAQEFDNLTGSIREMAKELPHTVEEISSVAEISSQLGISKDILLEYTETMLNLGVSTNLSAEEAAEAIARFANVTGMSQSDAERFGSTIVELGNNFATTEREITDMSMRLAGAGSQIGMSESEILALATALSSVGLESEMGGSAFSRLMLNIERQVETGGAQLENFSRVAGMSAQEFSEKWKNKPTEALNDFVKGLGSMEDNGESAIVMLEEMGITETRLTDALLRSSGASDIFTDAIKMGSKAWEENTTLAEEASLFNESEASKAKKRANTIRDSLIDMGKSMAPVLEKVAEVVGDVAQWFTSLDESTQETIVKFGLFAAAVGPVLTTVGPLVGLLGKVGGLLAGGSAAAGAASVASGATAAAGATTGLGTALGALSAAAGPIALGVGAIAATGYAIKKGYEEAIPTVDLFADEVQYTSQAVEDANGQINYSVESTTVTISEETKAQIGSFMELAEQTQQLSTDMYTGLTSISNENINTLTSNTAQMTQDIIGAYNNQKTERINIVTEMFGSESTITSENQEKILQSINDHYSERIKSANNAREALSGIFQGLANGTVQNSADTQQKIAQYMDQLKEHSVSAMSENEIEQNVIMQRLKSSNTRVTTEMVSEAVKQMNSMRDQSVEKAESMREEMYREAETMRSQLPESMKYLADDMIKEADRMAQKQIDAADNVRNNGLYKLKQGYGDIVSNVDTYSGRIVNQLDQINGTAKRFKEDWNKIQLKNLTATVITNYRTVGSPTSYTSGATSSISRGVNYYSHYNGLDAVPYDGYMARLHKGERVLTAKEVQNIDSSRKTNITIENFINNDERDIKRLADELDFYMNRTNYGKG